MHKIIAIVITSLAFISFNAYADYDSAKAAFNKRDYATAFNELRPLADQGSAKAQIILSSMYLYGLGVSQDNQEAAKWMRLAADQGNATAQSSLGMMYVMGQGVPFDNNEAAKWLQLAAAQGDAGAKALLCAPDRKEFTATLKHQVCD